MRDVRRQIRQICPSKSCFAIKCSDGRGPRQGARAQSKNWPASCCFFLAGRTFRLGEVKMRAFPRDELLATEQLVGYPLEALSRVACGRQSQRAWLRSFPAAVSGRAAHPAVLAERDQTSLLRISLRSLPSLREVGGRAPRARSARGGERRPNTYSG